jgi:DNA invertase Pin-like site-specific DNA recombinase
LPLLGDRTAHRLARPVGDTVLVGFGVNKTAAGGSDSDQLRALGCTRIFLVEDGEYLSEEVINYLRSGDTLVAVGLDRIGNSIEDILSALARLHEIGIAFRAEENQIIPGTPIGDAFLEICRMLTACARALKARESGQRRQRRRRGRPVVLGPDAHARAERLLREERASVLEIARLLRVSPATIYRYFPRRSPSAAGPDARQKGKRRHNDV